jgi:NADH dehydrogenase (ubiquinone) Fe-S protein 1
METTNVAISVNSAVSEVVGVPLPYDDVLSLRDRMWEISPTLVRYGSAEKVSPEVALAGLAPLGTRTVDTAISGTLLKKPISNFYQTDPVSRA